MPRGSWMCPRCHRGVVECRCDDHEVVLSDGVEIRALDSYRWIVVTGGRLGRIVQPLN